MMVQSNNGNTSRAGHPDSEKTGRDDTKFKNRSSNLGDERSVREVDKYVGRKQLQVNWHHVGAVNHMREGRMILIDAV